VLIESVEAMRDLGAKLATHLQSGDVVVLRGNLGAGKTALTQGIGRHLGKVLLSMSMHIGCWEALLRDLRLMIWTYKRLAITPSW
jgi:ABC-type transport system involved in cytochrome c biogenesis ATPase subunit